MRVVLFCVAILVSSCAQAKVQPNSGASAKTQAGKQQTFALTPTTQVCVSAMVSDDIPGPNHAASTDEAHGKSFGAEIVRLLERRSAKHVRMIEQFHLIPDTWPEECRPEANPIRIDIRYTLNGRGKPFRMDWSVTQGSRRAERHVERDIFAEIAAGADIGSTIDEPIGEAIADDKRARAAEIAALLR